MGATTEQWAAEIIVNPQWFITLNLPPKWKGDEVARDQVVAEAINRARRATGQRYSPQRHRLIGWWEIGEYRGCLHLHGIANNGDGIKDGWKQALLRRGYSHAESDIKPLRNLTKAVWYSSWQARKEGENPSIFK